MKNKFIIMISILCLVIPSYRIASSNSEFVWSQISNPTIETVSSINKDKR